MAKPGTYEPFLELTEDNHGPIVVVVAYILIITTSIIGVIRGLLAWKMHVAFQWDDTTFAMATVLAVAHSVCWHRAAMSGLGRHEDTLAQADVDNYYRLSYSAQLIGIFAMTAAKSSVALLFTRIAPASKEIVRITFAFIIAYFLFAAIGFAFQCNLPQPWLFKPQNCPTHGYLEYPIIIFNMGTDLLLAGVILPTVWSLKMDKMTRLTVIFLFGLRIFVPLFSIAQLVAKVGSMSAADQTWSNVSSAIWEQVVVHLSVITSTIPRTHSFWSSLHTGFSSSGITDTEYEMNHSGRMGKSMGSTSGGSVTQGSASHTAPKRNSKLLAMARTEELLEDDDEILQTRLSHQHSRSNSSGISEEPLHLVPPHLQHRVTTKIYSGQRPGNNSPDFILHNKEASSSSSHSNGSSNHGEKSGRHDHHVMGSREDEETSETSLREANTGPEFGGVWQRNELTVKVEYTNGQNHRRNGSAVVVSTGSSRDRHPSRNRGFGGRR